MASATIVNPQTFNRYTYCSNSPLTLTDPTGMFSISPGGGQGGTPLVSLSSDNDTNSDQRPRRVNPPSPSQPQPASPANESPTLDVRKDPKIADAVRTITANGSPLPNGIRPELTDVVVVEGQTSTVTDTVIIDSEGNRSGRFTGTIQPIAYIPLDQNGNIIPAGNGVVVTEKVTTEQGAHPTTSKQHYSRSNGVFIDLQSIAPEIGIVGIKQTVTVSQGRNQIVVGPNVINKDPFARTITFRPGPKNITKLP
jgi:hypothetical protein